MSRLGLNGELSQHARKMCKREQVAASDRLLEMMVGSEACPRLHRHQPGDSLWVSRERPLRAYPTSHRWISIHQPSTSPEEDTTWT